MGWNVQELDTGDRRYRLFEFTSDVTPLHHEQPLPVVGVDDAGRAYLLNQERQLAAFVARVLGARPRSAWRLAQLVASLAGAGNERVIRRAAELTDEGRRALSDSGVSRSAPEIRAEAGATELIFMTVSVAREMVAGQFVANFHRWTVRALPDGTADWQHRPVSLGVVGGIRI
jgi:hypothetical protein